MTVAISGMNREMFFLRNFFLSVRGLLNFVGRYGEGKTFSRKNYFRQTKNKTTVQKITVRKTVA